MHDTDQDGHGRRRVALRDPAEFLVEATRALECAIAGGRRVQLHIDDAMVLAWQPAPPPGSSLIGMHKGQIEAFGDIDAPGFCLCCGQKT